MSWEDIASAKSMWILTADGRHGGQNIGWKKDQDGFHPLWSGKGPISELPGARIEWRKYSSIPGDLTYFDLQLEEYKTWRIREPNDVTLMSQYISLEVPKDSQYPIGPSFCEEDRLISTQVKVDRCTCGACHIKDSSHSDWCDLVRRD